MYKKYLPADMVLPCDIFPRLNGAIISQLKKTLRSKPKLYIPIFSHHHWIAGILTGGPDGCKLSLYDSAPNRIVHEKIVSKFVKLWPGLTVVFPKWPRQTRFSDDCGLFMTACFFMDYLKVRPADHKTLPSRMRAFLHSNKQKPVGESKFLEGMARVLTGNSDSPPLLGGSHPERSEEEQDVTDPLLSDTESTPSVELLPDRPVPKDVSRKIDEVKQVLFEELPKAQKRGISFYTIASALANIGDGRNRSLTVNSIGTQVYRKNKKRSNLATIADALQAIGCRVDGWSGPQTRLSLPIGANRVLYLESKHGARLPPSIDGWKFTMGAFSVTRDGKQMCFLTERFDKAACGVYLSDDKITYVSLHKQQGHQQQRSNSNDDQTQTSNTPQGFHDAFDLTNEEGLFPTPPQVTPPESNNAEAPRRSRQNHKERMQDGLTHVLSSPVTKYLNTRDSPEWRLATCPRRWNLHRWRPPHVSKLAWDGVSRPMRLHHIRCLQKLMTMPEQCMSWGIAQMAIECVRRDALAKGWKAATVAKEMSATAGALRDLPLYTTEERGIFIQNHPEWKAAQRAIRRLQTEADPTVTVPLSQTDLNLALSRLKRRHPMTAVYLAVMWSLAARAGDVDGLRRKDLVVTRTEQPDAFHLSVHQKFGKGAKFRGSYYQEALTDSWTASQLTFLKTRADENDLLFPNHSELRDFLRDELRHINQDLKLPSVRRGAIIHMASTGVPQEKLMKMMGHKRIETLQGYLGLGRRTSTAGTRMAPDRSPHH